MKLSLDNWWIGVQWFHGHQRDFIYIGLLLIQFRLKIKRTCYWEVYTNTPIDKLQFLIAKFCGVSPHQAKNHTRLCFETRAQSEHFTWLVTTWNLNKVEAMADDDIPF